MNLEKETKENLFVRCNTCQGCFDFQVHLPSVCRPRVARPKKNSPAKLATRESSKLLIAVPSNAFFTLHEFLSTSVHGLICSLSAAV